jgi:hypothetical protein
MGDFANIYTKVMGIEHEHYHYYRRHRRHHQTTWIAHSHCKHNVPPLHPFHNDKSTEYWFHTPMVLFRLRITMMSMMMLTMILVVDVARYDDSLVTWQHPYCVMVLALRMSHWVEGYI